MKLGDRVVIKGRLRKQSDVRNKARRLRAKLISRRRVNTATTLSKRGRKIINKRRKLVAVLTKTSLPVLRENARVNFQSARTERYIGPLKDSVRRDAIALKYIAQYISASAPESSINAVLEGAISK